MARGGAEVMIIILDVILDADIVVVKLAFLICGQDDQYPRFVSLLDDNG